MARQENRAVLTVTLRDVFKRWLELTSSFHKLTNQEIDVVAAILYHRHIISKEISNELYLSKILFGTEMRKQIREDVGIKPQLLLNIYSNLRKKGVIKDSMINKPYIPNVQNNKLRVIFDFKVIENG